MRNTKQKNLILDIVNKSHNHPTANEIYKECLQTIPNISLGTVYRNLNKLVKLGYVQKIEVINNIVRFDKPTSHDHFICINCSKIIDLKRSNITYGKTIDGNKIIDCKVRYEGICCDCLKNK